MISAAGRPNWSRRVLKVALRELVEVAVERLLTGDGDQERRALVGALHAADDVVDAVIGRLPELHHRRVAVLRDGRGAARVEVGADVVDAGAAHVRCEPSYERAELRRVDRVLRRAHDDDVREGGVRGGREGPLERVLGPLGLRVVGRLSLRREGAAEQRPDGDDRGTIATTQAAIVRHGCRALAVASACVRNFIRAARAAAERSGTGADASRALQAGRIGSTGRRHRPRMRLPRLASHQCRRRSCRRS